MRFLVSLVLSRALARRVSRFAALAAVLLLQVFVAAPAAADFPAQPTYAYRLYDGGFSAEKFSSRDSACVGATAYYTQVFSPQGVTYDYRSDPNCHMTVERPPAAGGGTFVWLAFVDLQHLDCPGNSTLFGSQCVCNASFAQAGNACMPAEPSPPLSCRAPAGAAIGNPILPATGEKALSETDLTDAGEAALSFTRLYRSAIAANANTGTSRLGTAWRHNHAWSLSVTPGNPAGTLVQAGGTASNIVPTAIVITPEGYARSFDRPDDRSPWNAIGHNDTLSDSGDGTRIYRRADDDSTFVFDSAGRLQKLTQRNGWTTRYAYDAQNRLILITNAFGRTLSLNYNAAGQIASITGSSGKSATYAYDAVQRLTSVTFADGKSRGYLYENAAFPQALTGVTDESGARFATYTYDTTGRAIATEHAGAQRYAVSYPNTGVADVTDPLGTTREYRYSTQQGKMAVTGSSLINGAGEPDAMRRSLDANGLVTEETDFGYVTTQTTWDTARRLPLTVTRAVSKPEAQTVTTQWHPTFALPTLISESGRTTAFTYDVLQTNQRK